MLERIGQAFAALGAANEAILRSPSEDVLFQRVCDAAVSGGTLIDTAAVMAGPDGLLRIVAVAGDIESVRDLPLPGADHFIPALDLAAIAVSRGRSVTANDYLADARFASLRGVATALGARSCAALPIKKGGSIIGALVFYLGEPDALDRKTVTLLERMAENVSFALDIFERERQDSLAEQAKGRVAHLYAALSATNEAIMRASSRAELCQMVCDAAVLGGSFTVAAIAMLDDEQAAVRVVAAGGPARRHLIDLRIAIDPSGPYGNTHGAIAFRTREPNVSNDCLEDARLSDFHDEMRGSGTRSVAAWPLLIDGESIGILVLTSTEVVGFTPELVQLMQRLADNVSFALGNFDRADQKAAADQRLTYLATHDALTGLANRALFSRLLAGSIEMSRRHDRKFAVLFVDLDRFKTINDTLGHAEGDVLLVEVGRRLRESVRASDTVARLGGDEFVIIAQEITDSSEVMAIGEKILSTILKPVSLHGQECRVTASIGAAIFPNCGMDEQTLTKNADIAMYRVKEEGKNGIRIYTPDMKGLSVEYLMLETGLRHALERREFVLHYQPKRELASGRITGVEALLRWAHPDLGILAPNQFVPLAEETGLIVPIGKWVLETACLQNMAWQRDGLPALTMAVNLSPRQFTHERLLQDLDEALAGSGMPAALLELEITESMVMHDVGRAIDMLGAIKRRGVRLAMDDFGTGYSSMSAIKQFPVDTLKIDRCFVRDLAHNSDDRAIAEAIIGLGKAMGLTIIAEGVETTDQETFLREHACDEMQGFLFSRAMPPEELAALFRAPAVVSPPLQPSSKPARLNALIETG